MSVPVSDRSAADGHAELASIAASIRAEAAIADRPGQLDRLEALAAQVDALELRPSLSVQSEEALVYALWQGPLSHADNLPLNRSMSQRVVRFLIESGVVQVADATLEQAWYLGYAALTDTPNPYVGNSRKEARG